VIAEYIRRCIYDRTAASSNQRDSVYVSSITNHVRRQLSPVWPRLDRKRNRAPSLPEQEAEGDIDPDPVRRVLEALDDLRDVVHLGLGYWALTPLRLVRLSQDTALVVGGMPIDVARAEIAAPLAQRWISRTVSIAELPAAFVADHAKWQATSAWLGAIPSDLGPWTTSILAEAARRLKPSASDLTEFELYQPALNRSRPQAFRWVPARTLSRPPQGLQFCRTFEDGRRGMRRYWIGTVGRTRTHLRSEAEYPIDTSTVRRLHYGIDARERAPTRISVLQGADVVLTLTNPLPPEERRLFTALGEDCSARLGKFPLRYRFDATAFDIVRPLLEQLSVQLTTD
jgi:hypothetical protein